MPTVPPSLYGVSRGTIGKMSEEEAFLLVATPDAPSSARETVVLIAVHGDEGSLGFVLNRPSPGVTMGDALIRMGIDPLDLSLPAPVLQGGRVRPDAAWLLFDGSVAEMPADSCRLAPSIHVTASAEATVEILQASPSPRALMCLGHRTWEAGELDAEITSGQWLRAEARASVVFDTPLSRRWSEMLCSALGLSRPWLGHTRFARA